MNSINSKIYFLKTITKTNHLINRVFPPFSKLIIFILLCCGCILNSSAQQSILLNYTKNKSEIKEGGCNLFTYNDTSYVICVSQVIVGTKTESACKIVGSAKAKRDILAFINGSDITSATELKTTETITDDISGTKSSLKQEYVEIIKEQIIGSINQCVPLGGWYSDDQSIYFYAIYKTIY